MTPTILHSLAKHNLNTIRCHNCNYILDIANSHVNMIRKCPCQHLRLLDWCEKVVIIIALPDIKHSIRIIIDDIEDYMNIFNFNFTVLYWSNNICFSNLSDPIATVQELETILTFL